MTSQLVAIRKENKCSYAILSIESSGSSLTATDVNATGFPAAKISTTNRVVAAWY